LVAELKYIMKINCPYTKSMPLIYSPIIYLELLASRLIKKIDTFTYTGDELVPIDGDDPQHITWIYEKATDRAAEFNISGVSYRLTQV
jgi:hypothetical protein